MILTYVRRFGANFARHNTQKFCVPLVGKMDKICPKSDSPLIVNKHEYITSKRRAVTLLE